MPESNGEPVSDLKVYRVVVWCRPTGKPETLLDVDILSLSREAAARRARWSVIATRKYGDVDDVDWRSVEEVICQWFALCDRTATGWMDAGPLGEVPICTECKTKVEALKT